jgi:hypothetical protein
LKSAEFEESTATNRPKVSTISAARSAAAFLFRRRGGIHCPEKNQDELESDRHHRRQQQQMQWFDL